MRYITGRALFALATLAHDVSCFLTFVASRAVGPTTKSW